MGNIKVRYLVVKPQKNHSIHYWQPAKALREHGFQTRRLAEKSNDIVAAIREAEALNAELDAWRKGEKIDTTPKDGTIPCLVRLYQRSEKYANLVPKTQRAYDQCLQEIEAWSDRAGHPPINSITPLAVEAFYKSMADTPHKANAVIRVLRLLMNRALKYQLIDHNPAAKPELKTPPPRHHVWTDDAIEAVVSAAEDRSRRSVGLAVMLAAHLGQREGDVLRLAWSQYDGEYVSLRQQKTKKPLAVPATAALKRYLDLTPRSSILMVTSETTGRPYREDNFRHVFAVVRNSVGLSDFQFRDLRRTAAVGLAEAGCTAPEIAAITGHTIETTQRILETYVPRTTPMARNAIAKLERNKQRPKLEG